MGFLNSMGLLGDLFGGGNDKVALPDAVKPSDISQEKTPSQIADEEAAKKKAALVAANAGVPKQTTMGGGNADVTRKVLLGL